MTWKWHNLADHWEDCLNVAIGAWLVVASSGFGLSDEAPAAVNAFFVGSAIVAISLLALFKFDVWEEWLVGALGLWAIVAPWVLGFADHTTALWTHLTAGWLVAGLAAIELLVGYTVHAHDADSKHPV